MWIKLTGKLDQSVISSCRAIAVKYNNNQVHIKEASRGILALYDLSSLIQSYRIIK